MNQMFKDPLVISLFVLVYNLSVIFIRKQPDDLRQKRGPIANHISEIRGTIFLGNLVLLIYLIYIPQINSIFSWVFIAPFVHGNLTHLFINIFGLAIMSLYEIRVGLKRYLTVFLLSLFFSSFSSFFYKFGSIGISGGVFGLGAGYVIDHENQSLKSFLSSLMIFAFVMAVVFIPSYLKNEKINGLEVDHLGHFLGAISAIVYIKLKPLKN